MKQYILSLDQGTTSSRCIAFDDQGIPLCCRQKEIRQIYPEAGWVEHDPKEILDSQLATVKEVIKNLDLKTGQIAAMGITNQRETVIVWDKYTGEPIYNGIVWQCRRTSEIIEHLKEQGLSDTIKEKTGLIPDAYFSASKIKWILDTVEGAKEKAQNGDLLCGTVDTWLIWNLTKGQVFATDYTNASRTMLFNIHDLCWDQELLEIFDIPKNMLPKVHPSSYCYGKTECTIFGEEIVIGAVAGDQQAALFGQCCFDVGDIKNTYGTGCFLLMNTGSKAIKSSHGLLTSLGASGKERPDYVLEGSVFSAGSAVQWLRDELSLIDHAKDSEQLAQSVADTNGVYIVPAFTGLGAPYWQPSARGIIVGLTRGATKAHLTRAVLEAIAYQTHDVIRAMESDLGKPIGELKVDGGAAENNFLLQFQADMIGTIVKKPMHTEITALGVAYLAGLTVGYFKNLEELKHHWQQGKAYQPQMAIEKRDQRLKNWEKAIECMMIWS